MCVGSGPKEKMYIVSTFYHKRLTIIVYIISDFECDQDFFIINDYETTGSFKCQVEFKMLYQY